jgi:ABC-type proline/glycine betaine transport system permease subunit
MLGVNQTVIMALAMQTVTPLVAGLGLGKEVYDAMNIANTGKGLTATVDGREVLIGNRRLLRDAAVDLTAIDGRVDPLAQQG